MSTYIVETQERFNGILSLLQNYKVSGKTEISVKPYKKSRSNAQNRLYWCWLSVLSQEIGYTKDELHEFFKHKFLGSEYKTVFGAEVLIANSSADLKVQEFTDYLTQIEVFAMSHGFMLPHTPDYDESMGR